MYKERFKTLKYIRIPTYTVADRPTKADCHISASQSVQYFILTKIDSAASHVVDPAVTFSNENTNFSSLCLTLV